MWRCLGSLIHKNMHMHVYMNMEHQRVHAQQQHVQIASFLWDSSIIKIDTSNWRALT